MATAERFTRQARWIRLVLRGAVGLFVLAVVLALLLRFRPDALPTPLRLGAQVGEGGWPGGPGGPGGSSALFDTGLVSALDTGARGATGPVAAPATGSAPEAAGTLAVHTTADAGLGPGPVDPAPAQGTSARSRRRAAIGTDVILLPCSLQNPRADGGFIIPPHNPRNRTVVGLPSKPGEPKRGFFIPPHDPGEENRIPIDVVVMDTFLDQTIRVPPHDPNTRNVVYRDTIPCLQGQ